VALAGAAHRLREDVNLERLLAAVGLRQAAHPDERVVLDLGQRRGDDAAHHGVIRHLDPVDYLTVARAHRQHRPVDRLDRAAHANRRGLLRKARARGEQQRRGKQAGHPSCHLVVIRFIAARQWPAEAAGIVCHLSEAPCGAKIRQACGRLAGR
jgi:hypothetical protein